MKTDELIKSYGKALYEIALAEDGLDRTEEELFNISQTIRKSLKLKDVVEKTTMEKKLKKDIFKEIFEGKISPLVVNFVLLLIDNDKEKYLSDIIKSYSKILLAMRDVILAEVTSAIPLKEKELDGIEKMLNKKFNKKVKLRNKVDEGIVGGFVIKVGDKLIDASLKTKLASIKQEITVD